MEEINLQSRVLKDPCTTINYRHGYLEYGTQLISKEYTVSEYSRLTEIYGSSHGVARTDDDRMVLANENKAILTRVLRIHYQIELDAFLAACVQRTVTGSRQFCKGFLEYVKLRNASRSNGVISCESTNDRIAKTPWITLVTVHLLPTQKEWIDYKWNYRICDLVAKKVISEDAMAWLNTLGGGYSALGDYFEHHAREAGRISLKQFKIAMELGDPPTVIRCRLYYALSLMQTKRTKEAAHIVRYQYHLAKRLPVEDHRLTSMCKGIWSRLVFVHRQKPNLLHKIKFRENGHTQ